MKYQDKTKEKLINELTELRQRITELEAAKSSYKLAEEKLRAIKERYLFSLSAEDGTLLSLDPAFEKVTGWSRAEWVGKSFHTLFHPDDLALAIDQFEKARSGETPPLFEARALSKSGAYLTGEFTVAPYVKDGKVVEIVGFACDITDRKQAEEALEKNAQLLRDTGAMAKVGGWELDLSTKEVLWTEEVGRIHGVEPGYQPKLEEAMNFYAPESRPALEVVLKKAAETGEPYDLESLFIPSGSKDKIWVRSLGRAVYSGGKIVKLAGTFQNIDKYKRAEEALRESEATIRALIDSPVDSILLVNPDGIILDTNQTFAQRIGRRVDELIGRCVYDFLPPEQAKSRRARVDEIVHFGIPIRFEDGRAGMQLDQSAHPIFNGKGKVTKIAIIARDITERKQAENELRKFKTISDKADHGITIVDLEGNVSYVNTSFARMHGYTSDELIGEHLSIFHTEQQMANVNRLKEQLKQEGSYVGEEVWHKRNDNTEFPTLMNGTLVKGENGTPLFMAATAVDITERKRTEEALQASETKYRIVADNTYDWEFWTSPEGRFLYTSPSCKRVTGHAPDEFIADPDLLYRIVHPDDRPDFDRHKDEMTQQIAPYEVEFRVIRPDGTVRWIGHACQPVFAPDGHFLGTRGSNRDITERKRAEEGLQKNLTLYRGLIETTDTGFVILDQEGKVLDANQEYVYLSGHEDFNQIRGRSVVEWTADYEKERNAEAVGKCFREGQIRNLEIDYVNTQGKITPIEINATVVKVDGASQILTLCRDITERKRVEEALRRKSEEQDLLLNNIQTQVWYLTDEETYGAVNKARAEFFGKKNGEMENKKLCDVISKNEAEICRSGYVEVFEKRKQIHTEEWITNAKGEKRLLSIIKSPKLDENGDVEYVVCSAEDITERKRVEEALRESEERYRTAIEHSNDGVAIVKDGFHLFVNKKFLEIFGYDHLDEIVGKSVTVVNHPDDRGRVMEMTHKRQMRKEVPSKYEFKGLRKDGGEVCIEVSATQTTYRGESVSLAYLRDITERKRAEDEVKKLNEELERRIIERTTQLEAVNKDMQKEITERKRVEEELKKHEERLEELVERRTERIRELEGQRAEIEKLAAAGLVAARIAHEINNPLAGIKNSFMLVKDAVPEDHRYYEYVGRIDNEINRIARIVRQMFDVYRPEQEIKKEFSVDKTLYEVVALLETAWRENNITIEIDSKPITMEMPEGLLRQVLYNILLNAIEASPQGGVVKIMTEVNNEILTLLISDQGAGIPLEVQPRIFELFFTSKDGSRKGLGLGLSVSKDIVEKLGGHIDFESEPGKGTLFRIILPLKSGEKR